ncbi:MAG TPA: ABC transporter permease [bacterium]
MFRSYLKIWMRVLFKHKTLSLLNIAGLALGLTCAILILFYVRFEMSFDRFHEQADRIYRLVQTRVSADSRQHWAVTPTGHAPSLTNEFSQVKTVRFLRRQPLIRVGEKSFSEERFFFADSLVFEVFSFPWLEGNPATALQEPFTVVITEEYAKKYFGDDDALGKVIRYEDQYDFKITGIMRNIPSNSHLQFDFLASFVSLQDILRYLLDDRVLKDWVASMFHTYVMLPPNSLAAELERQFPEYIQKYLPVEEAGELTLGLQPLTDIYLGSNHFLSHPGPSGDQRYLFIFSAVALFILLISCINFVNLSLARSTARAGEVGLRKVVGAQRPDLIKQYLGESLAVTFLSAGLAIVLSKLLLPLFNHVSGKNIELSQVGPVEIGTVALGILFIGILSGIYPAIFMSALNPIAVWKGKAASAGRRLHFRKTLIVMQFVISTVMIISTLVVFNQLQFLKNQKLGFNKDQILVLPLVPELKPRLDAFKSTLLQFQQVAAVSASSMVPGRRGMTQSYRLEGVPPDKTQLVTSMIVDHDFVETYGLELVAGRNFSIAIISDQTDAFLINETAAREFGWSNPLQKRLEVPVETPVRKGQVVGVVKDFHFQSLHHRVEPLVLRIQPFWFRYVSVQVRTAELSETIAAIEASWREFVPNRPFDYFFLDDDFAAQYRADERLGLVFGSFTLLAIVIAVLGLFGIAMFTIESRRKEIGVRKVIGASIPGIVALLTRDYFKLIALSLLLATPVAYFAMQGWLQNFAYRISQSPGTYLSAGLVIVSIVFATIAVHALRAAAANPVHALRQE